MGIITLGQAVRNAIETERAAARFYRGLAAHTDVADAQAFLEDMAAQEDEHATDLARFAMTLVAGSVPDAADVDLSEVELVPEWAEARGIGFDAALEVAIDSESRAHAYYASMAEACTGEARGFFARMAHAELGHAQRLQDFLEAWRAVG